MLYDDRSLPSAQAQPILAHTLRAHLVQFLRPLAEQLASHLDIRLVQTAVDLVQVIITHRHRALGLLLTELGGYLLAPAQAPAGAKRISNLIHAADWSADDIGAILWQQASERVQALEAAGEETLLVWDGSVWEKPESQANADWCVVRSAKGNKLLDNWGEERKAGASGTGATAPARYQEVAAPLNRLRSALSRLWQAAPPPGYHLLC